MADARNRLEWLDGVRGLAALQVVLLHYVTAFLPRFDSHLGWLNPLRFFYDGSAAVFLFFIISGSALTYAFTSRPLMFAPAIARRIIRLGLPMAAATALAAAAFVLLPDAHVAAAGKIGSGWLRDIHPPAISVTSVLHQIALEGLIAGFQNQTLLPHWLTAGLHLATNGQAFDTPLWTLHVEFLGSILVMLLVALRASASRQAYHAICIILGIGFILSPLALFILGHVAAGHLQEIRRRRLIGAVLLVCGILLCVLPILQPFTLLWHWLPYPLLGRQGDDYTLQKTIGTILVFAGLAGVPALQAQLKRPVPRFLGKISFSLYLIHLPIASTGVCAALVLLSAHLPYTLCIAVCVTGGIAASLMVATVFQRWIDHPSIMISRRIAFPQPAGRVSPAPIA